MTAPPEVPSAETDSARLAWIRERLYVPAVCDILDDLGRRGQAMHQRLRPLAADQCVIVGRARTFRWMETDYVVEADPYGLEIDAMDSLKPGDVAVHSTDPGFTNAPWGELMSTVAQRNGAAGCICDSMVRDCLQIMKLRFPVFCATASRVSSCSASRVSPRGPISEVSPEPTIATIARPFSTSRSMSPSKSTMSSDCSR